MDVHQAWESKHKGPEFRQMQTGHVGFDRRCLGSRYASATVPVLLLLCDDVLGETECQDTINQRVSEDDLSSMASEYHGRLAVGTTCFRCTFWLFNSPVYYCLPLSSQLTRLFMRGLVADCIW